MSVIGPLVRDMYADLGVERDQKPLPAFTRAWLKDGRST